MPQLPNFNKNKVGETAKRYERYLRKLIDNSWVRNNSIYFYEFLEIGQISLDEGVRKFKEGCLKKRTGGRHNENKLVLYCGHICRRWMVRWFVVCQDGILYSLNSTQSKIREMLLFDSSFKCLFGRRETGSEKGITLVTPTRTICLKAFTLFEALDWLFAINEARRSSPYTEINRYLSFAPIRAPSASCKHLIDGENYFSQVCESLLSAEKEIFITGWWLSPELYLKRPVGESLNQEYRLDRVFKKELLKRV